MHALFACSQMVAIRPFFHNLYPLGNSRWEQFRHKKVNVFVGVVLSLLNHMALQNSSLVNATAKGFRLGDGHVQSRSLIASL